MADPANPEPNSVEAADEAALEEIPFYLLGNARLATERAERYAAEAEEATASGDTDRARRVAKYAHEATAKSRAVATKVHTLALRNVQEMLDYTARAEQAERRAHEAAHVNQAEARAAGTPMSADEIRTGLLAQLGVSLFGDHEKNTLYISAPTEHYRTLAKWLEEADTGWTYFLEEWPRPKSTESEDDQEGGPAEVATLPSPSED